MFNKKGKIIVFKKYKKKLYPSTPYLRTPLCLVLTHIWI